MSRYGSVDASRPLTRSPSPDPIVDSPQTPDVQIVSPVYPRKDSDRANRTSITICGTIDDSFLDNTRYGRQRSEHETPSSFKHSQENSSNGTSLTGQHCHDRQEVVSLIDRKARCKLITACVLCLLFMTAEIVGGILANSLAIATDAAHLLTDFASFLISLFSIYLASRPATKSMSFGWHRAEVMGALVSVLFIWIVTGVLVYMAAERVSSGNYEIDSTIMLIISAIGIAFNIVMLATLHDTHGHSHGHSHSRSSASSRRVSYSNSHNHSNRISKDPDESQQNPAMQTENALLLGSSEDTDIEEGHHRKGTNINVRAAFIHVLGDLLQSIGVLVAALVIYFKPEYKLADPLCTFVFSVLVLITTITILRDTLNVLMEGTPKGIDFSEVKSSLTSIPGVLELHNLRLWSLTTSRIAVSVHLAVAKEADHQEISTRAGSLLRARFGIHECTVQTEQFVDEMKDCTQCQDPRD